MSTTPLIYVIEKSFNSVTINTAFKILKNNGVIALPTDTVYGLACLLNETALNKLYEIKKRQISKPVAFCLSDVKHIHEWCKLANSEVLESLLPGPYTLIFEKKNKFNLSFNPGIRYAAVRVPDHPFIIKLCKKINEPVALTSANLSNDKSCSSITEFSKIWSKLDAIFDGGNLGDLDPSIMGSTIIDLSVEGKYRIIRNGCALEMAISILENKFSLKLNKEPFHYRE